jgi:hypothetical protein
MAKNELQRIFISIIKKSKTKINNWELEILLVIGY